jgi:hypothetical protein
MNMRTDQRKKDPLKTLEVLGCEKYVRANITGINTVLNL